MRYTIKIVAYLLLVFYSSTIFAQTDESPINIFGYFQNQFKQEENPSLDSESNTFLVQQLNIFFQKNLQKSWSAFLNIEFLNSFSSSRNTGAINLEEVWLKYRLNKKFSLKMGLLIPTFNHLNRIKNQTPVLPYIIRPLVYESSLSEVVPIDEFTPSRAFIEVSGILPTTSELKFDYALFLGNSPNISTQDQSGQSGIDTTVTFLLGSRVGVRFKDLKLGISSTYDETDEFQNHLRETTIDLTEIPRVRLGLDLSYDFGPLWFQGELISLLYDEGTELIRLDKNFFYATLGWRITDELITYASLWQTRVHNNRRPPVEASEDDIQQYVETTTSPNFGAVYHFSDRIVFKGQYVHFTRSINNPRVPSSPGFNIFSLAVSVNF